MSRLKAAVRLTALGLLASLFFGGTVAAKPLTLLAFGDSLVHGYGLPAGSTFPEQLEAALAERGYAVRVVNSGNSGETTAGGRARLDWVLAEPADAAIVVLGGNDLLRGLDPAQTYDNLDAILTRFDAAGIPTLLAGMAAPRNLGADYVAEFDAIYPRLAEAHDSVVFYPFFLDGVALDPALNQDDGLHPNAAGVRVIVERLLPDVIALLARVEGPPAAAVGG
jgi:acyl-CoA thioesterase-1